ncbi:MAG: YhfZ family protein [Fusobacteriaceae bacterium]
MNKGYKKIEQGILNIAKDLLEREVGNNLDTMANYSKRFSLSLGTIQKALLILEEKQVVTIKRKGKMGSLIMGINYDKLFKIIDLRYLLCVMPITYSTRYKKLMEHINSNLKITIPLYFSHMRGGDVRLNLIDEGVYQFGVVSKLAAQNAINSGLDLDIIADFGPKSYVTKHVILKKKSEIKNIGRDHESNDHFFLTNLNFQKNENLKIVDIKYSEVIENLLDKTIDAAIWNYDDVLDKILHLKNNNIVVEDLEENSINILATEAVIVARSDDTVIKNIFHHFFKMDNLKILEE